MLLDVRSDCVNVFHFEGSHLGAAVKEEWLAMAAILSKNG
jgi:hypothetical protein